MRAVLVEELQGGELRVMSTEKVSEHIRDIGQRLVGEHGEALEILANHDPDAPQQERAMVGPGAIGYGTVVLVRVSRGDSRWMAVQAAFDATCVQRDTALRGC